MLKQNIQLNKGYILVTGGAGFIGAYLIMRLLKIGCKIINVDCVNDYYDIALKEHRLQ